VAVELGAEAEAASNPAKTADKTIGRASLITRQLQASTSAPGRCGTCRRKPRAG
jgi:hypothetical protein